MKKWNFFLLPGHGQLGQLVTLIFQSCLDVLYFRVGVRFFFKICQVYHSGQPRHKMHNFEDNMNRRGKQIMMKMFSSHGENTFRSLGNFGFADLHSRSLAM